MNMKSKNKILLFVVCFLIACFCFENNARGQDSILFFEDFETNSIPVDWEQEYVNRTLDWRFQKGGYSIAPSVPLSGRPPVAYSGDYNALFHLQSTNQEQTKLVTKPISSMEFAIKPELRFWYAQDHFEYGGTNELWVYYKNGKDSAWIEVDRITATQSNWTERVILLPDSTLSADYYIAFEGLNKNGWGNCLDHIQIFETGILDRHIDTVLVEQVSTEPVSSGLGTYPILLIEIKVRGNEGEQTLQSIAINSLNTLDSDIDMNGVRLYYTREKIFNNDSLLHGGASFSGGIATLSGMDYRLKTGINYFWVTYDINPMAVHGNHVDAAILANSITINGKNYPSIDHSPVGKRTINESVFYDDFETDKGWVLVPEFEIDTPQGKGGLLLNSDPQDALSGSRVLGTDLTGLGPFHGDYESRLDRNAYTATSPTMDLTYFKDVKLNFSRWLNIYFNDTVAIEVSKDDGNTWTRVWQNVSSVADDKWSIKSVNLANHLDRMAQSKVRFTLGGTDTTTQITSGWNIDDLSVTGDYILNDVGVLTITAPMSGCGHSDQDDVTAIIKNYGPTASHDTIPVAYSINGGVTFAYDTLFGSIPQGGTALFTFTPKADLSKPGNYNLVVKTMLELDEYANNDPFDTSIFVVPEIYPPYSQNFETNNGYWQGKGNRNVWEWGNPQNTKINAAASGQKAWVTDLNSYIRAHDSVFLESPCFNFTGMRFPILECKVNYHTQRFKEGAAFYYSIDDGSSWQYLDTLDYRWDWDWYADTLPSIGKPAIDSASNKWVTIRQFMPENTVGQSNVKIRLLFIADTLTHFSEGIGLDDFKLFEAPVDVGISHFLAPDSACELSHKEYITVAVKNYAVDTLFAGTSIPLGFDLNGNPYATDTLVLALDLAPLDTVHFTFPDSVDMFKAGKYYIDVYTLLAGDTDYYVESVNNDTLSTYVSVYGMPEYDLGPTIGMEVIDTVLDAGAGYAAYDWENGDGTTRYYHVTLPGTYNIEVTNVHGCVKTDSVKVLQSAEDLGVIELIGPLSDCEFSADTVVSIKIKNFKAHIYNPGDTIYVGYQMNNGPIYIDTIELAGGLDMEDTLEYTLNKHFDFSNFADYHFVIHTILEGDLDYHNDTLYSTLSAWGYPNVEIGPDTLFTTSADTITFDAGAEFATYLWQDGSTAQTFSPTVKTSKKYNVEVTDVHGCGTDRDSVQVIAYNLGIQSLVDPASHCEQTSLENIEISIRNYGDDTLAMGTQIPVAYQFEGGAWVNEMVTLGADLLPASNVTHTFATTEDLSVIDDYQVKVYCSFNLDAKRSNDTLATVVSHWGYPVVDLGADTIYTNRFDTVKLVANPGYFLYEWSDGTENDTLQLPNGQSKWYTVEVTNTHACITSDSVYIFTHDVSVADIASPENSCALENDEEIQISLYNHGVSPLPIGTPIEVNYKVNGGVPVTEQYVLPTQLNSGNTISYTFAQTYDMSAFGDYTIEAYATFKHDVDPVNDKYTATKRAYGYPDIDLGPDTLFTKQADTLVLVADPGYTTYEWNTGTLNDSLVVTETHSSLYTVMVTQQHTGFNCKTSESVYVYTKDLGVENISSPNSQCELSGNENISIKIRNHCSDTFATGQGIDVGYQIGTQTPIMENMVLQSDLLPGGSVDYTFTTTADFSNSGDHILNTFTQLPHDVSPDNDALVDTIHVYGYPDIGLGTDTIFTKQPDTVVLSANAGYALYQWNTGHSSNSLAISQPHSAWYKVYVESIYGCNAKDSTYIYSKDLGIKRIEAPWSDCELTGNETVTVKITNFSADTFKTGQQVTLGYQIGANPVVEETWTLNANLMPGDSASYSFSQTGNFAGVGSYTLRTYVDWYKDVRQSNDELTETVEVHGYPSVYLGKDTTVRALNYILDAGGPYVQYEWQDGSNLGTFEVRQSGTYSVAVVNDKGCGDSDTVDIIMLMPDFSITGIVSPASQCYHSGTVTPRFRMTNTGTDTIRSGETVTLGYYLNGTFMAEQLFNVPSDLIPGDSTDFTLNGTIDVLDYEQHHFRAYSNFARDLYPDNDTLFLNKTILPFPAVELGNDTVLQKKTHTLHAPEDPNFSYAWQDASANPTFNVVYDGSLIKKYKVKVTDDRLGCSSEDDITITFRITDIQLQQVTLPLTICQFGNVDVGLNIKNQGNTNISMGKQMTFGYLDLNGVKRTYGFATNNMILSGQSTVINLEDVQFVHPGNENIKMFITMGDDTDHSNDSLSMLVDTDPAPVSGLGGPSDTLKTSLPVTLTPLQGAAAYKWDNGDSSPTFTAPNAGWYWVDITGSNGCTSRDSVFVMLSTSVKPLFVDGTTIKVYPVPATHWLHVISDRALNENYDYVLYNNLGAAVFSGTFMKNEKIQVTLPVESLSRGLYYLKIYSNNKAFTQKIILKN
jgi:hypothetical protein